MIKIYNIFVTEQHLLSIDNDARLKIAIKLRELGKSKFRSSFRLKAKDIDYIDKQGLDKIKSHARDFITERLAPADIPNDGKQTPMRNHPVFIAQHATGTCCRDCLYKWHHIKAGVRLTDDQVDYIINVIMAWIITNYVANKKSRTNNRDSKQ